METRLEKKSFEMIALQQPVTTDLRMIITVMKASSDLERMADHAVSVAKSTDSRKKGRREYRKSKRDLRYVRLCEKMVDNVLVAYVQNRRKKTHVRSPIWIKESMTISIESIMQQSKICRKILRQSSVERDYLNVASYLERIGDYVTNICEWIVYLATGKITELNTNHNEIF